MTIAFPEAGASGCRGPQKISDASLHPYFLAQNSTTGGPASGPLLHSTSRSPIEIGNVLGPQKAEIATSSSPQPLGQPLDRQSSRRTARCPAGPAGPMGPADPAAP